MTTKPKANTLNNHLSDLTVQRDLDPAALRGWTPIKIQFCDQGPLVAWLNFQDIDFGQPRFFKRLVEEYALSQPYIDKIILTPIETMIESRAISPGIEPTGFIFHVSRCGSTLLANLLLALPKNRVLIEPHIINKILLAPTDRFSMTTIRDWLQASIRVLGPPYLGVEKNYFIKFSSWNILNFPLIRAIFPDVPCLILYRDPVEVMVSHLNQPGGWLKSKRNSDLVAKRVQLPASIIDTLNTEEYCARVLGNFYAAATRATTARALAVNYNQISGPLLRHLLDFVGVEVSDEEIAVMMTRMRFYAKDPHQQQIFVDDRARKQMLASPTVRALAHQWVSSYYEQLESRQRYFNLYNACPLVVN